ncbi:MAG: M28 family peptidase, partial [Nitrospinae bacterium]|nr:M28 family peptidase [Nitrospinota bacterium]
MVGHYDSISTKTAGWEQNWRTLPAPGASDNASGVAEMRGGSRILSKHEFDFTIRFIAFSGEELFLFGSK